MSLSQELRASLSFSYAFVRPYSVSLAAVFLAQSRNYCAELASETLSEIGAFTTDEIRQIQSAIVHHSDKDATSEPFYGLLKAAAVLQHQRLQPAPRTESTALQQACTYGRELQDIRLYNGGDRVDEQIGTRVPGIKSTLGDTRLRQGIRMRYLGVNIHLARYP